MKSLYKGLNMAISMFTIIPLPKYEWDEKSAKHMMKLYPLIGLIIGSLWYGSAVILSRFNCPIMLKSAIIMMIPFLLTGFLHLDGFMDLSDALLSGREKEEKIRILKDSRVGAFAVISLGLLLIVQFSAIYSIFSENKSLIFLMIIPILSRALAGYFLISINTISESYLGNLFREGTNFIDKVILISVYLIISVSITFFINNKLILLPIVMLLVAILIIIKSKKELGGINGDVSGYVLVIVEVIGLVMLALV